MSAYTCEEDTQHYDLEASHVTMKADCGMHMRETLYRYGRGTENVSDGQI